VANLNRELDNRFNGNRNVAIVKHDNIHASCLYDENHVNSYGLNRMCENVQNVLLRMGLHIRTKRIEKKVPMKLQENGPQSFPIQPAQPMPVSYSQGPGFQQVQMPMENFGGHHVRDSNLFPGFATCSTPGALAVFRGSRYELSSLYTYTSSSLGWTIWTTCISPSMLRFMNT
jgi:hypothetical protein